MNPLSGTLGAGFPTVAAGMPFGMVTPGPATTLGLGEDPVNYVGYGFQDPFIRGFPLTHFNGAGVHIAGELPFMPTTGAITNDPTQFASPFTHVQEKAEAGSYSVDLPKSQTKVELTSTTRVALQRYTFPSTKNANVLLDLGRNNESSDLQSELRFVNAREVAGSVYVPNSGGFTIWFTARFDQPMKSHGTWQGSALKEGSGSAKGKGVGGWATFDTTKHQQVGVRIGLSYVDARSATENLDAEAPASRSFESLRSANQDAWRAALSAIEVTGGASGERATFYTNLYRALLMPSIADDVDGSYRGFDDKIRTVTGRKHHYTGLSLWDTYRTQTPLLALVAKDVAHDIGVSLMDDTDQNAGIIPKWVQGNRDYSIMNGDSGTPTLASLVTNGALTGAEAKRAYALVRHQALKTPQTGPRDKLVSYLKLGYVPHEEAKASMTLEYAMDDAAVAELAKTYGSKADQALFAKRSGYWRNLMAPDDHFLRPRMRNGSWATPTDLGVTKTWNPIFPDGWTEGTGWQYLWSVPQDVAGLVQAMGGQAVARQRLDSFFSTMLQQPSAPVVANAQTQTSFFGIAFYGNQFTPANEPDLQAPWLYNWLGQPAKASKVVHASSKVWTSLPNGLPGNDDTGSMSAWYVLAAMGLYQPQAGSPYWVTSTPFFDSVRIKAASGRVRLAIEAPHASPLDEYVASATLNGAPLTRAWLRPNEVTGGATLRYALTSSESSTWATAAKDAPPSLRSK